MSHTTIYIMYNRTIHITCLKKSLQNALKSNGEHFSMLNENLIWKNSVSRSQDKNIPARRLDYKFDFLSKRFLQRVREFGAVSTSYRLLSDITDWWDWAADSKNKTIVPIIFPPPIIPDLIFNRIWQWCGSSYFQKFKTNRCMGCKCQIPSILWFIMGEGRNK